jgi:tRNA-specific 2-thiouridylase
MTPTHGKVVVAMSGGVDSSVAAALLRDAGWEVTGVTMRLPVYGGTCEAERACCGERATRDARLVAGRLGIPHYVLDFREEFRRSVIADFCGAYARGRTPNPCARCNERVKFGALLRTALAVGSDYVATGHYVRKVQDGSCGAVRLGKGAPEDDQSYFLYGLSQEQLRRSIFPLAELDKAHVRARAAALGLPVHDKPGSQDLCFLPGGDYRAFLREHCPQALQPGPIVHVTGRVLGAHEGVAAFTIGQRRGLGIAYGWPLYVVALRPEDNTIVVGEREHLLRKSIEVADVSWMVLEPAGPIEAQVKVRYNHAPAEARVTPLSGGRAMVRFAGPVEAPSPGQSAVFYQGDLLLGGGTIESNLDVEARETCLTHSFKTS